MHHSPDSDFYIHPTELTNTMAYTVEPTYSKSNSLTFPPKHRDEYPLLDTNTTPSEVISSVHIPDIRETVNKFLSHCNVPFSVTEYDHEFHRRCCQDVIQRGHSIGDSPGFHSLIHTYIPVGVVMATTAYAHLNNETTRIFIVLYTAFLTYLDDAFEKDVEGVSGFNERFIKREPQGDVILDVLADILHEIPQHFGRVVSNIMMTSTLNLITALLLEHETQRMTELSPASSYASFSRVMAGAAETYSLFTFPRELPLHTYIQALPEMMIFINNGNDVLSFYKEELAGEQVNCVSTLARCHSVPKINVLRKIAEDAIACDSKASIVLRPHKEAYDAYVNFRQGYIGFHSSSTRYKLTELLRV